MCAFRTCQILFLYLANQISGIAQSLHSPDSHLHEIMAPIVATNNYAGNVLILHRDSVIFSKSYGMMDEEKQLPNTLNTQYMLASTSMVFTSAAIMKLVETGQLSLSDKLSRFFPNHQYGDQITIHHMLAQRSGIPAWDGGWKIENFNRKKPHSIEKLMSYFMDEDLLFEPGSRYAHGRSEYILLAAIIEQVTGQTFGEYLRHSIFTPLGMHNSGHYSQKMTDTDLAFLAKGYTERGFYDVESAPEIHWSVKTGHASIYSTVEDLRIFSRAILHQELLSPESWGKIMTDYGQFAGYGWFLNPQNTRIRYQMNGRSPGFSSYFGIYPEDNLVVIMLSNRYVSLPHFIGPELASATLGGRYETLNLSLTAVDKELASRIVGQYQMGPNFYRPNGTVKIKYSNGKLYAGSYPLIPILTDEGITSFIHRHYWSRLTFTEASGDIQLFFDQYSGIKQSFFQEWKWIMAIALLTIALLAFIWLRKRRKQIMH